MSSFRRIRAVFRLVSVSMVATAVLALSPLLSVMDPPFQTRPVLADETKEPSGSATVAVATFEGVINPVAAEYFAQVIADAAKDRVEALVIRMDTPGGLDTSMRMIIKEMSA